MWLAVLFGSAILALCAGAAFLYWDYVHTPQRVWAVHVLRIFAELGSRIQRERRRLAALESQQRSDERTLKSAKLAEALAAIPVEELRGFPGIGPATIVSLRSAGFTAVGQLRDSWINIPGFGAKRVSDVLAAAEAVGGQKSADLANPDTANGQNLMYELESLATRFRQTREHVGSCIRDAEAARENLAIALTAAKSVTFLAYLLKSPGMVVSQELLNTPLPDAQALFAPAATSKEQRSSAYSDTRSTPPARSVVGVVRAPVPTTSLPSSGFERPLGKAGTSVSPTFVGKGARISVGGYELVDPLIYVVDGGRLVGFDASLLCLRGEIGSPRPEHSGALGYWPQLSELQPHQVGNYLQWMANGRQDPSVDLGYVFLFFYGLERRALVDGEDILNIGYEVLRLLGIYKHSRSFCSYATGLLCYLVMVGRLSPKPKLISRLLDYQDHRITEGLRALVLGHLARGMQPLPAEWAFRLAEDDERARRSVVTEKCRDEFAALFDRKYEQMFSAGIVPQASAADHLVSYHPASPTLLDDTNHRKIPVAQWPTVPNWRAQFSPVVDLWNECIEELRRYARTKAESGRLTAESFEALPAELQQETQHPEQQAWDALLLEFSANAGTILLPVSRLAQFRQVEQRARLTLTQSRMLADLAEALGTPLEPDARYTGKSYQWDAVVAAIRLPEKGVLPEGRNYALAAMVLRLALEISEADGETDAEERRVIAEFLEERFMLVPNDRHRLNALVDVQLHDHTSLAGLKKSLEQHLNPSQCRAVGKFLVMVAAETNGISTAEHRALERMYQQLGLDEAMVASDTAELDIRPAERPVRVQDASPDRGEAIPPPPPTIDLVRIRKLRAESDEVAKMLITAMTGTAVLEEDEEEPAAATPEQPSAKPTVVTVAQRVAPIPAAKNSKLDALRPQVRPLLLALRRREQWPTAEAESLAREYGTTLTAAVDEINEWADEQLGDFVIEHGSEVTIRVALLVTIVEQGEHS